MSDRSSFTTESIDCEHCRKAAYDVICEYGGWAEGATPASPIFGGFMKYADDMIVLMRRLQAVICCPMRVAFLPDESGPCKDGIVIYLLRPHADYVKMIAIPFELTPPPFPPSTPNA